MNSSDVQKDTEANDSGILRRRDRAYSAPTQPRAVNSQPFAGRVGGNQLFTVSPSDPNYAEIIAKVPDAAPAHSWAVLLDLRGFRDFSLWTNAFGEGMSVLIQVFLGGLLSHGLLPLGNATSLGPVLPVGIAAIMQFFTLTLFIFAVGPITGAHFSPLITLATFFTQLTSLPRAVLYIIFQCIGAVIGAFILRGALGASPEDLVVVPGCYIDPKLVTPGQAFALETVGSFSLLFLAFGLGLDPRNGTSFGPSVGPWLVGFAGALILFAGGISRPGYLGFSNSPARCLGLMAASNRFTYHYIHWTGDIAAAL